MRRPSFGIIVVAFLLWLVIAFVLDRYALALVCSTCSNIASIKFQTELPALQVNLPSIGLLILIGLPLLVSALIYVPWKSPRDKTKWGQAVSKWCQPIVWALVAVILIVIGQALYLFIRGALPQGVQDFAEAFKLTATVYIMKFEFMMLEGSLTAIIGLIGGCYLFLEKGIRGIWNIGQEKT